MSDKMIAPRIVDLFFQAAAKNEVECNLKLNDIAVLKVMADRIGSHESAYMSASYIANYLRTSLSTVERAISKLKTQGYIVVDRIKTVSGFCNHYHLGKVIHNLPSDRRYPQTTYRQIEGGVPSDRRGGYRQIDGTYNTNIIQTKQREGARRARATPLPVDNFDTEDTIQLAKELNLDHTKELLKFRTHSMAKGTKNIDWSSAFKKWLLDSIDHTVRTAKSAPRPLPQEQSRHYPTIDEIRAQSPEPKGGREHIAAQVHALAAKLKGGRLNGYRAH